MRCPTPQRCPLTLSASAPPCRQVLIFMYLLSTVRMLTGTRFAMFRAGVGSTTVHSYCGFRWRFLRGQFPTEEASLLPAAAAIWSLLLIVTGSQEIAAGTAAASSPAAAGDDGGEGNAPGDADHEDGGRLTARPCWRFHT